MVQRGIYDIGAKIRYYITFWNSWPSVFTHACMNGARSVQYLATSSLRETYRFPSRADLIGSTREVAAFVVALPSRL